MQHRGFWLDCFNIYPDGALARYADNPVARMRDVESRCAGVSKLWLPMRTFGQGWRPPARVTLPVQKIDQMASKGTTVSVFQSHKTSNPFQTFSGQAV